MFNKIDKNAIREGRHYRMRKNIVGNAERPRLNVYRSTTHIYAQVIDDTVGNTLVAASTLDADIKGKLEGKSKVEQAALVGELVGARAKAKGVSKVVFDRGGFLFHGRVKALADAAREGGLEF